MLDTLLLHQALHDPLTGLPNRALLLDRLTHALARLERSETSLGLLFVDTPDGQPPRPRLPPGAGLLLRPARPGPANEIEGTLDRLGRRRLSLPADIWPPAPWATAAVGTLGACERLGG